MDRVDPIDKINYDKCLGPFVEQRGVAQYRVKFLA